MVRRLARSRSVSATGDGALTGSTSGQTIPPDRPSLPGPATTVTTSVATTGSDCDRVPCLHRVSACPRGLVMIDSASHEGRTHGAGRAGSAPIVVHAGSTGPRNATL